MSQCAGFWVGDLVLTRVFLPRRVVGAVGALGCALRPASTRGGCDATWVVNLSRAICASWAFLAWPSWTIARLSSLYRAGLALLLKVVNSPLLLDYRLLLTLLQPLHLGLWRCYLGLPCRSQAVEFSLSLLADTSPWW